MKLTSIRLTNVRRFVDPVEITGIGPGLNLLSAPNEQGKSTIFDALHALFFKDAKSWDKEVRALAPHAGGDPEIEVELTHQGSHFRIAKSFTKSAGKGTARIWREGGSCIRPTRRKHGCATSSRRPRTGRSACSGCGRG
ncbi:AAA family ATPase [Phaeobacter sp. BS23]|uniref:AAA family ATPase n=1 Tax=Phaeobacter sp. BS23 TaxID=2907239 RepID=UPI0038668824